MKVCIKCDIDKSDDDFYLKDKGTGRRNSTCKECVKLSRRNRYHSCPEYREQLRKWKKDNLDKVKRYKTKEYEKNREDYIARAARWRDNNRIVVRQIKRRYKIKRKSWELSGVVTEQEWLHLLEITGFKCLCCGATDVTLTQDHVVPLSKGGANTIDNIQPLCGSCNSKKHTKIIDYRSKDEDSSVG